MIRSDGRRFFLYAGGLVAAAILGLSLLSVSLEGSGLEPLPWETWGDLHRLAEIHAGHQALLHSSRCPDGCRYDRHSADDWRYLRVEGDEGVIFEESGAGAITRIWMTMGSGTSVPLDPEIRLRIYIDGDATPRIDVSLPEFFDGSVPPFLPPLVGHRLASSGGNFSYVPIPYQDGCRVALVGANEARIWYQFNFHRLADGDQVESFSGDEDLSGLVSLLALQGQDPWPTDSGMTTAATRLVGPGEEVVFFAHEGHGSLTALKLRIEPSAWPEVEFRLAFDGQPAVAMPLADFFAVGRVGAMPTRSLFVGLDDEGFLYAYFPMPFFEHAELVLFHTGASAVLVDYEIRFSDTAPSPSCGLFGSVLTSDAATAVGSDLPLLSLTGAGKLIGAFFELGSTSGTLRDYLEGDERIFLDRSPHPSVYGTGVEDFFNGGFYFDQGPLSNALHGSPYTELEGEGGLPMTAAYRMMLTDGITFQEHLEFGLEGGPTGNVSMKARTILYFYRRQRAGLNLWDSLDMATPSDRDSHFFQVPGPHQFLELQAAFEGEPAVSASGTGVYRPPGAATFVMRAGPASTRYRLRRRFDAGFAGQRASILVGGEVVGFFPPVGPNEDRRWREIDVDLSERVEPSEELLITVVAEPGPPEGDVDTFTAFRYELWSDAPTAIFSNGFDNGDLAGWSRTGTGD